MTLFKVINFKKILCMPGLLRSDVVLWVDIYQPDVCLMADASLHKSDLSNNSC